MSNYAAAKKEVPLSALEYIPGQSDLVCLIEASRQAKDFNPKKP